MTCLLTFVIYSASYQYIKYAWLMGNLLSYVKDLLSLLSEDGKLLLFWGQDFSRTSLLTYVHD